MAPNRPSPSGARLSGDRYQHLFTWLYGAQLLLANPKVTCIAFEISGAGNVDDLVVTYSSGPSRYHQIKFVTSQEEPLTAEWFTKVPSGARRSPLERFHDSFRRLSASTGEPPNMALLTNRWPEAGDVLPAYVLGRTAKLMPRIKEAEPGSPGAELRRVWSEHLGIAEDELLELLDYLELRVGRESIDELYEQVSVAMAGAGLRGDHEAMTVGMDIIKNCIETGTRELTADALRPMLAKYQLAAGRAGATLVVQAIDSDHRHEGATASVDWVDLFEGDAPEVRRQLKDPSLWNTQLKQDLRAAAETVKRHELTDVNVLGAMRLSTGVFVGTTFSRVRGFELRREDRGVLYASESEAGAAKLTWHAVTLGAGSDIAVAIQVSLPIQDAVAMYLESVALPVGELLVYEPAGGTGQSAVKDAAHAVGLAETIATQLRVDLKAHAGAVHLFIAGPLPLALLLGHRWNRIPSTQLYDDLGPGKGYTPTFVIDG